MKNKVGFLVCFLVMGGLVSCNVPAQYRHDSSQVEIEQQYRVVSALLTKTAQVVPVNMPVAVVSSTPSPGSQLTVISGYSTTRPVDDPSSLAPEASRTPQFMDSNGQALAAPCDLAQLGYPIDISVPDGTHFLPGEYFSKTWRLVNAGSCQWTPDYGLVWFSGTDLGLKPVQPLGAAVSPGESIDVSVDMIAPPAPGTYQSNWKLRNTAGELVGIGPSGDAPFWVRIVVIQVETPTVTPTVLFDATPTPGIYASGSLTLALGEGIDLDSAQINQEHEDDLRLLALNTNEVQLEPLTGVHLVSFGSSQPQLFDCGLDISTSNSIALGQDKVGTFLCYRTTRGLPGRITIQSVDLENGQIDLEFVTWVVP